MIGQTRFVTRTDAARTRLLTEGFEGIMREFQVHEDFPPEVLADVARVTSVQALAALVSDPTRLDLTHLEFVTLDPASSTDLDQAFCIEPRDLGADPSTAVLVLHYAIADVGAFVARGSAIEAEAWKRGETIYAPHRRVPLYPQALCEGAGSLLPGSPKPAIELRIEQTPDGLTTFLGARRCVIRSRHKLAYETVDPSTVPYLELFAQRSEAAEAARGAMRSDLPEQEIHETDDGHFVLELRALRPSETANAALSLGANLAAATFLANVGVGLFRVMEMPDDMAVQSLRRLARALRLNWPAELPLGEFQRSLSVDDPRSRAFLVAARRAGGGASYATLGCDPLTDVNTALHADPHGKVHPGGPPLPYHAAIAGTYLHATAPLRRLADRYVLDLLCDLTSVADRSPHTDELPMAVPPPTVVPTEVRHTLAALPAVMRASGTQAARVERAAVDLAECVVIESMVGDVFTATVLDSSDTGAVIQIAEPPVRGRLSRSAIKQGAVAGAVVQVRLERVDIATRTHSFSLVAPPPAPTS